MLNLLLDLGAAGHMEQSNTCNVAGATEELNFTFKFQ